MLKFSAVVPSEKMNEGTEQRLIIGLFVAFKICRIWITGILFSQLALILSLQVCRAMTVSRLKFCLCQIGVASVLAPLKSRPIVPFSLIDD